MSRFWEFQQLSDDWKHVSYFDQVPRAGKLYIGGLAALYKEPDPLRAAGITHVLSVLDFDVGETKQLDGLKHLHIRLNDEPSENLIKHFEETNAFIDEGLKNGGGVFVHCAMGVSRSATCCVAYLMWKNGIGRDEAIAQVKEGRERIYPNHGFMEQLKLYEQVLRAGSEMGKEEIVKKWSRGRYPPTKL